MIKNMRNMFAHQYKSMDIEQIWDTALNDVPVLENYCQSLIEENESAE